MENQRPASFIKEQHPPVTIEMLQSLQTTLDMTDSFDACVLFTVLACFWGQIRLGKFLPTSKKNFDSTLNPTWSHLHHPTSITGSCVLHLPNTKLGGRKGEDVMLPRQHEADPISALEQHCKLNFASIDAPLASYKTIAGIIPLTRCKFLCRLNSIFQSIHLPFIMGHCLRIGGTTHLLLSRVLPNIVKLLGHWSSDAFLRYWRSLKVIAPMYIELLTPIMRDSGLLPHSASRGVISSSNVHCSCQGWVTYAPITQTLSSVQDALNAQSTASAYG